MSAPAERRRLPVARRLLFGLVVLVAVLGAVEGILRLTLPAARRASLPNEMIRAHLEGTNFRYDPDLFWYWTEHEGSPVNEHGFVRDEPMTKEKPPGVTRVITFGDSQTFGAGVTASETYSAFAERALGDDWEVLNAGLSGYRTLNVFRLLKLKMAAFQPDAVVIDCMPYDSERDDGSLSASPTVESVADRVRRLLWHSRTYYVLRLGMEVLDPGRARWLDDTHATRAAGAPAGAPAGGGPVGGPGGAAAPGGGGAPGGAGAPPGGGRVLPRESLGNHGLIGDWGKERGVAVFFMQYAIMDEAGNHGCMTGPGELPDNGILIRTCERIQATGIPAPRLFQDRNHLTKEGNEVVGKIVADALRAWAEGRGEG